VNFFVQNKHKNQNRRGAKDKILIERKKEEQVKQSHTKQKQLFGMSYR
jgi:hypothetical protein